MYARIAVANASKNVYHFQLNELGKIKQMLSSFYPMFQPILAQLTAFQQQRANPPSAPSPAEKLQRGLRVEDLKQPPVKRQKVAASPSPASQAAPTPQEPATPATPATSSPRPAVKRSASKKAKKIEKVKEDKEDNALGIKLGEDVVTRQRQEAEAGRADPLAFISTAWGELDKPDDWLASLQEAAPASPEVEFDYSSFIDDSALALDSTMPTPELIRPPPGQELSPDSDTAVSPPSPVIIATQSPPIDSMCLGESIEDQWFNGFGNGGWKWEGELDGGSWAIEGINA